MKLRSQDDAERKASSIAQKLRAQGRGDLVTKMGLHADKVLARHNSNIEQHMKRKPEENADPALHAEWQKKLDKNNRFRSYWSGVSSGFRKHDPFFDHVGATGTFKESIEPKSEQDLIAESIKTVVEEVDGYSKVHLQTALARGQHKIYHQGKLVGHVTPRFGLNDPDDPHQRWVAIGLEHNSKGDVTEKQIPGNHHGDHKTPEDAFEAIKGHHTKQKIGEFVH